jgi:hypothetical protein
VQRPAARAAPQDLFRDRPTGERAGFEMRIDFAIEHPARQFHVADATSVTASGD